MLKSNQNKEKLSRIRITKNNLLRLQESKYLKNFRKFQILISSKKESKDIVQENNVKPKFGYSRKERIKIRVKKALIYSFVFMIILLIGFVVYFFSQAQNLVSLKDFVKINFDANFTQYIIYGFLAQLIDGALGMAYGVTVTTLLLGAGIPGITPAVASASMHASEVFTTGTSSLVYFRFRNINLKLFRALLWPGLFGTIVGVIAVSHISKEYFSILKPIVASYTMILGILILFRAFKKSVIKKKLKKIFPIAFLGGFLDSVGGGGWGPIVTSSLIAGGRHLRYAVGSAHLAKFFVAVASTVTFFIMIGLSHWKVIFGLVIGGMIAAPASIYLSNKIPVKKGLILVGILIILISLKTIVKSLT
jgi:uncharacterized membrane protein YfcA